MRISAILIMAMALLAAPLAASAMMEGPIVKGRTEPAVVAAKPGQAFSLELRLTIAPKLHINGPSAGDDGLIPTKVSFSAPAGISFAAPAFPPAHEAKVQFSDKPVKVYSDKVSLALSGKVASSVKPGAYSATAKISYQACDDQVCHMPASLSLPITIQVSAP
ncbi:MAG: protein-disulfide reductase DsbD N-terminal domain-containing protein [Desulfarculaceae bacterium]|nr:protein-disulfide reductase DsbD N-terminal domain-containing protein [Desulfarculaceae bacterium]